MKLCRKVRAIIRYHTPNKAKEPEKIFPPSPYSLPPMETRNRTSR